ncbi:hypothetical protein M407DRAFT_28132 [Tulasnella calospora MUT 4182]|uniref:Uncharacterized protein n=1 Tax=Tulasnella calospora MUT 4182 TaxID=1051891 RepID=A0A0C3LM07_9AGAM|nr:hypothetical protein M407DRAFT_28132 [Tulasnella calospora MUT 4182]
MAVLDSILSRGLHPSNLPYPIPNGTQVPTWADLDPSAVGVWSPTVASAYAAGPSASITPGLASPSPSSPSTPVGAIAGGVVGGAALFIGVGFGIGFLCFRVRRQSRQMQEDMTSSNVGRMHSGALPGQMSGNTPGSQATTAPLQQPQPRYSFYPRGVNETKLLSSAPSTPKLRAVQLRFPSGLRSSRALEIHSAGGAKDPIPGTVLQNISN